jgi:uncharacterized protein YdeI (YjbR/CyaY-like superfamily)
MPTRKVKTFFAATRRRWHDWLAARHGFEREVWLVFYKRQTQRACVSYEHAVQEALCFGWIDSIVKRIDEDRYARKFTPRKPSSKWSDANRQRYEELRTRGLLAPAGLQRPPTGRSYGTPRPSARLPKYIEKTLRSNQRAWSYFERLAPSYQRLYVAWIDSAKQEGTKTRRLREATSLLEAGRKLGLK